MATIRQTLLLWFKRLRTDELGQDLVEYALIVGCLTLGATSALNFLAVGIVHSMNSISSVLVNYV
jgi:Flp pilus assembly pilin Flp